MNQEFEQAVSQLAEEKGLSKEDIFGMIEAALAAAFRKDYGNADQNVVVQFDPKNLGAKVFDVKTVAETVEDPQREIDLDSAVILKPDAFVGDTISVEITPPDGATFGRIAAQTAKQVIIQRLREAERSQQFSDFKAKEHLLVNGSVQRVENDAVIVDLGRGTGILFAAEQIRGEQYIIGQRLKVLVMSVESGVRGPRILLSRSHTDFVKRLFESEVPEIASGSVEIKAIAREAGSRTKVAVAALQDGVDPIGACVGQKGVRVQTIMAELGGEKLDIIEWSDDPVKFISNALSPAKIVNVLLNEEYKEAVVGVLSEQLSLAIGRAGQNVRLAARLTGWKIDINEEKLDGEATPEISKAEDTLESKANVTEELVN